MLIREKVAYLKGLADGMQIDDSTNEGRLFKSIIDVLDDVALVVDHIEETQDEMCEHIEMIDEDLAELETIVFEEFEYEDGEYIDEVECPHCKETFDVFEDMLDDDGKTVECPICHNEIEVEWDCFCEECTPEEE